MKNIIIDADTGVDDSLAILYALRSPNFHVEGITTCFGNNNANFPIVVMKSRLQLGQMNP